MTNRIVYVLAAGLLGLVLASCGTGNVGTGSPARDASGFKLNVLQDSFVDGGSVAGFDLSVDDYGEDIVVNIKATDARDLKALYFSLDYNAEQYRPLTAAPGKAAGSREELLSLNVFKDRGTVWHGQVLANYQWKAGASGDGVVATVNFRKQLTPLVRTISTPPTAGSATNLTWDSGATTLNWYYYNKGDCDQNGEVNIADLTPIGAHFQEASPGGAGTPWPEADAEGVIDGDSNGEINIADLTPIGSNFLKSGLGGYNLYTSENEADYPAAGTLVENIGFATSTGVPTTDRRHYSSVQAAFGTYYWVKPSDGTTDGIESNLAITNPALVAAFTLTNPGSGSGTSGDPYIANETTVYTFSVIDPTDGDVSTDALTVYTVSPPAAGAMGAGVNTLDITDGFEGDFNVSCQYNGSNTNPSAIFMRIPPTGGGGLFIRADAADADWASVTGDGSLADPYRCAEAAPGFNDDFSVIFDLEANDASDFSGTAIDVNTLTWGADPPFIATFGTPGSFTVNMFTNGRVFAQDAGLNLSNDIYILGPPPPST